MTNRAPIVIEAKEYSDCETPRETWYYVNGVKTTKYAKDMVRIVGGKYAVRIPSKKVRYACHTAKQNKGRCVFIDFKDSQWVVA